MSGPSNETEAEKLQRRQVEALEKIAAALSILAAAVGENMSGDTVLRVRDR